MGRFESGWIRLERRCGFGDIGQRGNHCLGLWARLLMMATWRESRVLWNGGPRDLEPGQVLTGIEELAMSDKPRDMSQVRRDLEFLEKRQSIRQEISNRGRIITILNWERFYGSTHVLDNQTAGETKSNDNQPTIHRQAPRQLIKNKYNKGRIQKGGEGSAPLVNLEQLKRAYSEGMAKRYGDKVAVIWRAESEEPLAALLEKYSVGEAEQLVRGFCAMVGPKDDDHWFVQRSHALGELITHLPTVAQAAFGSSCGAAAACKFGCDEGVIVARKNGSDTDLVEFSCPSCRDGVRRYMQYNFPRWEAGLTTEWTRDDAKGNAS